MSEEEKAATPEERKSVQLISWEEVDHALRVLERFATQIHILEARLRRIQHLMRRFQLTASKPEFTIRSPEQMMWMMIQPYLERRMQAAFEAASPGSETIPTEEILLDEKEAKKLGLKKE